jgi:hypothetical protein
MGDIKPVFFKNDRSPCFERFMLILYLPPDCLPFVCMPRMGIGKWKKPVNAQASTGL